MKTQTTFQKRWLPLVGMLLVTLATTQGIGGQLTSAATVLIVFIITWFEKPEGFFASLGFKKANRKTVSLFLKAPLVAIGLVLLYAFVMMPLVESMTGQEVDLSVFAILEGNLPLLLSTLALVWVMAGFGEEIIFRGYMMTRFTRVFGEGNISLIANILVCGVIFSFGHAYQGITGQILSGVTGMIFAVIFHRNKNNLWFNIMVHGWFDTIALVTIYFMGVDAL